MPRKYFFFDIDNTLLVHRNEEEHSFYVPDSAKEALRRLRAAGHFTAIATGRSFPLAQHHFEMLDFNNMVCDGGNGIVLDRKLVECTPLPREAVIRVLRECEKLSIPWGVASELTRERFSPDDRFAKGVEHTFVEDVVVPGLTPETCPRFYKVFLLCPPGEEEKLSALSGVPWYRLSKQVLIIEPSDKAVGIRRMLSLIGGDPKDVVVFGDASNDLTMFTPEWTCIAMGNAIDELKARATYVTTDCDKDGIYLACCHFGWI